MKSDKKLTITESAVYMQGYVSAKKASGLDWARLRLAVEDAKEKYEAVCAEYERRIHQLEMDKRDLEYEIIRRDSEIEALKIAWRHREDKA